MSMDGIDNGIATPIPGMVPSFRGRPVAKGPGVVGPSGTEKLLATRPARAGLCSPNPKNAQNRSTKSQREGIRNENKKQGFCV